MIDLHENYLNEDYPLDHDRIDPLEEDDKKVDENEHVELWRTRNGRRG